MIPEPSLLDAVHADRPHHRRPAGRRPSSARSCAGSRTSATRSPSSAVYAQTIAIVVRRGPVRQLVRLDRRVRPHGPRPRAVRGADARGRAPAAVPQPQDQRLRRPLAARLPVVHADRRVPARAHGAPPRGVRPRRARHPPLPRLPDLQATRCAASSCATPTGRTGWKLFKGLLGAVRSENARPCASRPARSSARNSC